MTSPNELVERLREDALCLSGHSIDRGCIDSGLATNLADAASDTIDRLTKENERLREALGNVHRILNVPGQALFEDIERAKSVILAALEDK